MLLTGMTLIALTPAALPAERRARSSHPRHRNPGIPLNPLPVTSSSSSRALIDEHFLREGLLHPSRYQIKGYAAAPMLAAIRRLHLRDRPQQITALAVFIEQIGPEQEAG